MGRYRWRQRLPSFAVLPILHYCNRASAAASAPSPILPRRTRRRHFRRQKTGSRISTLFVAVAVIRSAKKTQKPLLHSGLTGFTPLCTGKLFRTSYSLPRFHEKTARKTLVSNCSRKPLLLLYSTTYYYIVLHSILLHRVALKKGLFYFL